MIYFIIFFAKLLENALITLRIIVIANNKKILGAFLTFVISIIWILSISYIVLDFKDYLKLLFFALGSGIGSYFGNTIEEKLALGSIIITFKVKDKDYLLLKNSFKNKNIIKTQKYYKFEIICERKNKNKIIRKIKNVDENIKISIIKIFNC